MVVGIDVMQTVTHISRMLAKMLMSGMVEVEDNHGLGNILELLERCAVERTELGEYS